MDKTQDFLKPVLNEGSFVFCSVNDISEADIKDILFIFREKEGITIVLEKELADRLQFKYTYIASWITLSVYSCLEEVGLTAAFSKALSDQKISCNVVAAYFHDHIFVKKDDAEKALSILNELTFT